jgi:aminoglycoside phosphotransferase (APT) family kinase protein
VGFRKLDEGGLNYTFLVPFDTDPQLVARIPYSLLDPKTYAVASGVATMNFLRYNGLPVPKIFAYSFISNNEAQTEYLLMEYVEGADLSKF